MKIYFSLDPETSDKSDIEKYRKFVEFLQKESHILYRAPYVLSENPEMFLRKEMGLDRNLSYAEKRDVHMTWIDVADILLADVSHQSEGMFMIVQRALDKPKMGLNHTPIIFIRNKKSERKFGSIVHGLIDSSTIVYFEYDSVDEVMEHWRDLLEKAQNLKI